MISVHSTFSINTVQDSSGGSRIEILGDLQIDWLKYQQKVSLLDCLEFGDPANVFHANTPDIIEVDYVAP
jgi:hypothetical protein